MAKGRGGGKTPDRVVELLQKEVERTSQAATARATALTLQTVQRYIKAIGEPSQATLEKLADYFKVSVAYLRGEQSRWRSLYSDGEVSMFEKMVDDLIKLYEISPSNLKKSLVMAMELVITEIEGLLFQHVTGMEKENEVKLRQCIERMDKMVEAEWPATDDTRILEETGIRDKSGRMTFRLKEQ